MKLHHIAIWTFRLEELKDFYVRFLGGTSNEKYINPLKFTMTSVPWRKWMFWAPTPH